MSRRVIEVLLLVVLISAAFVIGQNWKFPDKKISEETQQAHIKLEALRNQIQDIYNKDLQDYARLKSLEAKYQSANTILSKMMTIFLAELSLKLRQHDIDKVTQPLPKSLTDQRDSGDSKACSPQQAPSCPSLKQLAKEQGKRVIDAALTTTTSETQWTDKEEKLSEIKSEEDIIEFLDAVQIKNFFSEIAKASSADAKGLQKMQGSFSGTLYYDDPNTRPAEILMELDAHIENGSIVGNNEIKLSRDGKAFSHSSGSGEMKNYKKTEASDKVLFLDLGGKTGYLQLYSLDDGNTLIGNYYQQIEVSSFKKKGRAHIERR